MLDASAVVEYLLLTPRGEAVASLMGATDDIDLPHLADTEVLSTLRGLAAGGQVPEERARQALYDLGEFPARRWPARELAERVWELRHAVSAYDATYLALAEALDAELVTCDGRLARGAEGVARCRVRLLD